MAEYWVSTTGNDGNPGTEASPLANPQTALSWASDYDTIKVMAGSYDISVAPASARKGLTIFQRTGVRLQAVGGRVTCDCSGMPRQAAEGIYGISVSESPGFEIDDFTFTGCLQPLDGSDVAVGVRVRDSRQLRLRRLISNNNQGPGVRLIGQVGGCEIDDLDSHNNKDWHSTLVGVAADGLKIIVDAGEAPIFVRRPRLWTNSDDGISTNGSGSAIYLIAPWVAWNGSEEGSGHGLDLGDGDGLVEVSEFLSWGNNGDGFTVFDASVPRIFTNGTSYNNGDDATVPDGVAHQFRNVAVIGEMDMQVGDAAIYERCSFQLGGATAADLISTDSSAILGARAADGTRPISAFARPRATSVLVDGGLDLGFGNDVGAFQYDASFEPASTLFDDGTTFSDGQSLLNDGAQFAMIDPGNGHLIIAEPTWSDDAVITVGSSDHETSATPVTNLLTSKPAERWQVASGTSAVIILDRGDIAPWTLLCLPYTDAGEAATVRIRAANDEGSLTSSPIIDRGLEQAWPQSASLANAPYVHTLHIETAPVNCRWLRLDLTGITRAGRIYVSSPWQLEHHWQYPSSPLGVLDSGRRARSVGGVVDTRRGRRVPTKSLRLLVSDPDELNVQLQPLIERRGTTGDILLVERPGDSEHRHSGILYGHMSRINPISAASFRRHGVDISFEGL